jgi:hypothetical protein
MMVTTSPTVRMTSSLFQLMRVSLRCSSVEVVYVKPATCSGFGRGVTRLMPTISSEQTTVRKMAT